MKTPGRSLKLDVFDKYIAAYMLLIYARLGRLKLKRFSVTLDGFQINECVKNNNVLVGKTTTLRMHLPFLYISLQFLHNYDVKLSNFTF